MRVYVVGPMRRLPNWNANAFIEAEERWKKAGHHVFSPRELTVAMGYEMEGECEPGSRLATEHLKHVVLSDLLCICNADGIAVLPGWEHSRGCTVEVALAQFLDLPIYDAITMEAIDPDKRPWGEIKHYLADWEPRQWQRNQ